MSQDEDNSLSVPLDLGDWDTQVAGDRVGKVKVEIVVGLKHSIVFVVFSDEIQLLEIPDFLSSRQKDHERRQLEVDQKHAPQEVHADDIQSFFALTREEFLWVLETTAVDFEQCKVLCHPKYVLLKKNRVIQYHEATCAGNRDVDRLALDGVELQVRVVSLVPRGSLVDTNVQESDV